MGEIMDDQVILHIDKLDKYLKNSHHVSNCQEQVCNVILAFQDVLLFQGTMNITDGLLFGQDYLNNINTC